MNNAYTIIVENGSVVLFDEIHSPVEFIKKKLHQLDIYDENYNKNIDTLKTVDEVIEFIDSNNITEIVVYTTSVINPEVK